MLGWWWWACAAAPLGEQAVFIPVTEPPAVVAAELPALEQALAGVRPLWVSVDERGVGLRTPDTPAARDAVREALATWPLAQALTPLVTIHPPDEQLSAWVAPRAEERAFSALEELPGVLAVEVCAGGATEQVLVVDAAAAAAAGFGLDEVLAAAPDGALDALLAPGLPLSAVAVRREEPAPAACASWGAQGPLVVVFVRHRPEATAPLADAARAAGWMALDRSGWGGWRREAADVGLVARAAAAADVVLVDRRDGRHQLWSADPGAAERLQGVPGVVAAWGPEARRVIVSADDATALSSRLPRWVAAWSALPGVRAVASDSPPPRPSLDLVVDGAAAAAHQLSAAEVSRAAAAALAGLPMDGEVSRVRWGLGLDAPLPTALGLAPLSTWVEVTRGVDAPSSRVDGRPAATFWVTGGDPAGWAATAEGLVVTVDETRR